MRSAAHANAGRDALAAAAASPTMAEIARRAAAPSVQDVLDRMAASLVQEGQAAFLGALLGAWAQREAPDGLTPLERADRVFAAAAAILPPDAAAMPSHCLKIRGLTHDDV